MLKCGWVNVSNYVFEPAACFTRVCFSAHVSTGKWVFVCKLWWMCVYVYACVLPTHNLSLSMLWCLQYLLLCGNIQAGPREACCEYILFWEYSLLKPAVDSVRHHFSYIYFSYFLLKLLFFSRLYDIRSQAAFQHFWLYTASGSTWTSQTDRALQSLPEQYISYHTVMRLDSFLMYTFIAFLFGFNIFSRVIYAFINEYLAVTHC